jgi:hypothetical protein
LGYGHARLWLGALAHPLGQRELAVEHVDFAVRFHEQHRLLAWAAESHVWLARALALSDDTAAAREHAHRALELAQQNGYRPIEPLAAELLADTETDPHSLPSSSPGST